VACNILQIGVLERGIEHRLWVRQHPFLVAR
jgi:hypothetical protein